MTRVLVGALLVFAGVVFLAVQVMRHGRLSSKKRGFRGTPPTLEPTRQGGVIDPRANWLGYVLIALGALLLLTAAPA